MYLLKAPESKSDKMKRERLAREKKAREKRDRAHQRKVKASQRKLDKALKNPSFKEAWEAAITSLGRHSHTGAEAEKTAEIQALRELAESRRW